MPSVAFFLLHSFLRVFLLLPSAYLRFLSEALEFSDGDFCVVPVTAFVVFNPIFAVFTRYVRFVLFLSLVFVGCCWFAWASCLRLRAWILVFFWFLGFFGGF